MRKSTAAAWASVIAVGGYFALAAPLHSAPPDWAKPAANPIWRITGATWVDHDPNPRFAVYDAGTRVESDDVVLDKETGLVWTKTPGAEHRNWYDANYDCIAEDAGGRSGWRLPTLEELQTLRDPRIDALFAGHPFEGIEDLEFQPSFWSSTTDVRNPDGASPLCFAVGCFFEGSKEDSLNYVWCVRGGYGYDAY